MEKTIAVMFVAAFVFSCGGKKTESEAGAGKSPTYEMYNGDTINRIDANGRKQGLWITFDRQATATIKDSVIYKDNEPVK